MQTKVFDIFKAGEESRVRIDDDVIALTDMERGRLIKLFEEVKDDRDPVNLFPDGVKGTILVYANGLIAANISLSRINESGTQFLLFVYHMTPSSSEYSTNTFLVSVDVLQNYIEALS